MRFLLAVLFCVAASLAQDSAFSHLSVSVEVGETYPWGDLQDAVDNSLYVGGGVRYTYWDDFDGIVSMNYSYFVPVTDNEIVYGVHQVNGMMGLIYHNPWVRSIDFGVGFLCSWTRADYDEDKVDVKSFKKTPGGTLVDNETEFGWFFRVDLPVWKTEDYRVGFSGEWQELWTLPKRSNTINFGLFVERRVW